MKTSDEFAGKRWGLWRPWAEMPPDTVEYESEWPMYGERRYLVARGAVTGGGLEAMQALQRLTGGEVREER